MSRFAIEFILLGFYVLLIVKSAWIKDWPRLLYWIGATVLMVGVLMGMNAVTTHTLHCGDCLTILRGMADDSVNVSLSSPPYEDARLYGIGFKLSGQKWVDWMIPIVVELCRVTDGLVFINAAGKRKNWMYSPVVEWLVADLTRHHGIVCGPAPYVFHRVGIAGSGSRKYHRRDWEPIYAFARAECCPPKWTDNTALGHPPKWAPGGMMSNRHVDGQRKNAHASQACKTRNKWGGTGNASGAAGRKKNGEFKSVGMNQWAHSLNSGATVADAEGVVRSKGKRPSHQRVDRLHTKRKADGEMEVQGYTAPVLADPGNVLFLKVGGGHMGSDLAHENEAPFPEGLPEFFIRSFCPPGGTVLDPFCGSGTTLAVAKRTGRNSIGIDVRESQIELTKRRLNTVQPEIFT